MKISLKIISLFIIFAIIFCGCTNKNNTDDNIPDNNETDNKDQNNVDNNTTVDDEEVIGQLYEINTDEIKVLTNGEIKVFKIAGDVVKDYYIGEYIVVKKNGNDYDISLYDKYDFNNRKTDMGDPIKRIVGSIQDVGDEFITAVSDAGEIKINNPGNFALPKNANAVFDYIATEDGNVLVNYYDESVKLDLTVKRITRDVGGQMILLANNENKDYEIKVKPSTLVNVSLSSIKTGDKITVYPLSLSDDNPSKVETSMIIK